MSRHGGTPAFWTAPVALHLGHQLPGVRSGGRRLDMGLRDRWHHGLAAGLGLHHEDPVVQELAGLRRLGEMVFELDDEIKNARAKAPERSFVRADAYYLAADVLVTFADAFVLDAFMDPDHPNHVPHITFLQAAQFYRAVPALVTAVRREVAYEGSGEAPLPVLPGPRLEAPGRCPVEHLLAMRRAAEKTEELLGTRIELLQREGADPAAIKTPVLMMTDARTAKASADAVLGLLTHHQHVPDAQHEEAERMYYDGVLRSYLYAAQELFLPGITKKAPRSEDPPEEEPAAEQRPVTPFPHQHQAGAGMGGMPMGWGGMNPMGGFGGGGGGLSWGSLLTADLAANLVGGLMGGMFGGGMGRFR